MKILIRVGERQLKSILFEHKKWSESAGKAGQRADLENASLKGMNLRWADLRDAKLSGADLGKTDLSWANLSGADLSNVDLKDANLGG